MNKVIFEDAALEDIFYWIKNDLKIVKKIFEVIESALKNPFQGIGKPEQLKYDLSGFWSRKIDIDNRLVYCVKDDYIIIASCRFHYKK